jgi:phosphatidylserine decarboxylase
MVVDNYQSIQVDKLIIALGTAVDNDETLDKSLYLITIYLMLLDMH